MFHKGNHCNNNFYGNIYLEEDQHCFVVGNIMREPAHGIKGDPLQTTKKLYLQGNGGNNPTNGSDSDTKVSPNRTPGFTFNETKSMVIEYNPARGHDDYTSNGIGGEVYICSQFTEYNDPITSIQIVGNGVVGSWELGAAQEMTYNKKLDCWECTIT